MGKEKIVQEALRLFALKGYEGTSLSELAERSNMRKASIYSHFKNKEAIFSAVIDQVCDDEIQRLSSLLYEVQHLPFRERLNQVIDHQVEIYVKHEWNATFWKRMTLFPPTAFEDAIQQKLLEYEQQFNNLLEVELNHAIQSEEIDAIQSKMGLAMILCVVDGLFIEYNYYDREEFYERVHAVKEMTWRAFAPTRDHQED